MVTEKMIDAAARAIIETPPAHKVENRNGKDVIIQDYRQTAYAALEAALSTDAEPVATVIAERDALIAAGLKCCNGTPNPNLRPFDLAMSFIDSTNTARKAADMLWQEYKCELETLRRGKAEPAEWQLVYDDGSVSRSVYTKSEADDYELRSASVVAIRPLYAAPPAPSIAVKALALLDRVIGYEGQDRERVSQVKSLLRSALSAQVQDVAETEADIVERMVRSVADPFPSVNLSVSRGIDGWRELMRDALRAAAPAAKLE